MFMAAGVQAKLLFELADGGQMAEDDQGHAPRINEIRAGSKVKSQRIHSFNERTTIAVRDWIISVAWGAKGAIDWPNGPAAPSSDVRHQPPVAYPTAAFAA